MGEAPGAATRRTLLALAAGWGAGGAAPAPPRRIVSLNPCLDAILVQVADRASIAAISHYSHDPSASSLPDLGRGLPATFGSAEEIVALRPDLVLASSFTSPALRTMLQRLGIPFSLFDAPSTTRESLEQVRRVGSLVGRPERGQALAHAVQSALVAARPPPGRPNPRALVYGDGGFAPGSHTLVDEVMTLAGLENMAAAYGLRRSGAVSLERLAAEPPDLLLVAQSRAEGPDWADRVLRHPILRRLPARLRTAPLPGNLLKCGGPVLIDLARRLADARRLALEPVA